MVAVKAFTSSAFFMSFLLVVSVIAGIVAIVLVLDTRFPGALDNGYAQADLLYAVMLLVLIVPGILYRFRNRIGLAAKYVFIWGVIFAVAFVAMSYREELAGVPARLQSQLMPSAPLAENGRIMLTRAKDGHFYADAFVHGERVRFMIDSGASRVSLSYADAKRIGLPVSKLKFSMPVGTANGTAMTAPLTLDYVMIGDLRASNVRAHVARDGQMDGSLLGMSFLEQLGGWKVEGDSMYLWASGATP